MTGVVSDSLYHQIVDAVRWLRTFRMRAEHLLNESVRQSLQRQRRYAIIFDEDCPGVSDPTGVPSGSILPTQPNATRLRINTADGSYQQTAERLHVCNRGDEDYSEDDFAYAEPQDGVYVASGCAIPVPDRQPPPWQESET